MKLGAEEIMYLTGHEYLYVRAPFLESMRMSALATHKKFQGKCKPCMRHALLRATQVIATTFCQLVYWESLKNPNLLSELKTAMTAILNREIQDVVIVYKIGSADKELIF